MCPKSLAESTSPAPKWYCQTRLTMERHVSILSRAVIQWASAARRAPSVSPSFNTNREGSEVTQESAPGTNRLAGTLHAAALQHGNRPRHDGEIERPLRVEEIGGRVHQLRLAQLLQFLVDSLQFRGESCGARHASPGAGALVPSPCDPP